VPHYPEWEQSKTTYERGTYTAVGLLGMYQTMVDMSLIKGDGGGTQYTFLEAWDANTVPIINRGWLSERDTTMRELGNCLAVRDGKELAWLLGEIAAGDRVQQLGLIRASARDQLVRDHAPAKVGAQYMEVLND
jgi:hypothetical protein